jgi:hypothetical protein
VWSRIPDRSLAKWCKGAKWMLIVANRGQAHIGSSRLLRFLIGLFRQLVQGINQENFHPPLSPLAIANQHPLMVHLGLIWK